MLHTTTHTTQIVSPFGTGYVPEAHGGPALLEERGSQRRDNWTAVVIAVLFVAMTAATAISAKTRPISPVPSVPGQSFQMKTPSGTWLEDAVY